MSGSANPAAIQPRASLPSSYRVSGELWAVFDRSRDLAFELLEPEEVHSCGQMLRGAAGALLVVKAGLVVCFMRRPSLRPIAEGPEVSLSNVVRVIGPGVGQVAEVQPRLSVGSRRARAFLEVASPARPSLDELSMDARVSKFHLIRRFRLEVGVTPMAYHRVLRAEFAVRMLRQTPRSAAEIASECDYADESHMIRDLKRMTGRTAGQWRRLPAPPVRPDRALDARAVSSVLG